MWKIENYPFLDIFTLTLSPRDLFRIEDKPLYEMGTSINAIMMFTGLFIRDNGVDMIHCIPVHFYGPNAKFLTIELCGISLWLEIEPSYPEGYYN